MEADIRGGDCNGDAAETTREDDSCDCASDGDDASGEEEEEEEESEKMLWSRRSHERHLFILALIGIQLTSSTC